MKIFIIVYRLVLLCLLLNYQSFSQTPVIPKLVPDGQINKMEHSASSGLVMSGNFRYVGYPAKNMAVVDNQEGKPLGRFPLLTVTKSPFSYYQRELIADQEGGWYVVTQGVTTSGNFDDRSQQIWYDSTGQQQTFDCISHLRSDFSVDTVFRINRNASDRIANVMRVVLDNNMLYAWCYVIKSDGSPYQRKLLGLNAKTGAIEWDPGTTRRINGRSDGIGGMCKVGRKLFIVSLTDTVNRQPSNRSSLCYDLNTRQITNWNPLSTYNLDCSSCGPGPLTITGNKEKLVIQILTAYNAQVEMIVTDSVSTTLWHRQIPKTTVTNVTINDSVGYYHSNTSFPNYINRFRLSDGFVTQTIQYSPTSSAQLDTLTINVGNLAGMQLHGKYLYLYGISRDGISLRRSAVQIDVTNSKVTQWKPFNEKSPEEFDGSFYAERTVSAMSFQGNKIFLLGEFNLIRIQYAPFLAAINPITNTLSWRPKATSKELNVPNSIRMISLDGDSLVWVVQGTKLITAYDARTGDKVRQFSISDGNGNGVQIDQLIATADRLYIKGYFTQIQGQFVNSGFASLSKTGQLIPWPNSIDNGIIDKISIQGDKLYLGGYFTAKNGSQSIAILDRYTGVLSSFKSSLPSILNGYRYEVKDFFIQGKELFTSRNYPGGPTDFRKLNLLDGKQTGYYSYTTCGSPDNIFPVDKYVFMNESLCNSSRSESLIYFDQAVNKFSDRPLLKGYSSPSSSSNFFVPNPENFSLFGSTLFYASNYGYSPYFDNGLVGLPPLMSLSFPKGFFSDKVDYYPKSGGNAGDITVNFYGNSINIGSRIRLTRTGQMSIIVPDSLVTFPEPFRMQVSFNLRGQLLGAWNVEITTSSGEQIIIPSGFTINQAKPADIQVQLNSPSGFRPGGISKTIVSVTNRGDMDAHGASIWVAISNNADVTFLEKIYDDSKTIADTVYYMSVDSLNGKPFIGKLYWLFIAQLKGGEVLEIPLVIKGKNSQPFTISVWATKPMFGSPISQDALKCITTIAINYSNQVISEIKGTPNQVAQCVIGLVSLLGGLIDAGVQAQEGAPILGNVGKTLFKFFYECAKASGAILPVGKVGLIVKYTIDLMLDADGANEIKKDCKPLLDKALPQEVSVPPVQSHDPNDKLGPVGAKAERYVAGKDPFTYLIRFENDSTATAAAQFVRIVDTLDRNKVNFNTFQLNYFNVADTTFYVPPGRKQYAVDWDLRPDKNLVLRMEARFNDTTGVLNSTYTALDPITRQLTEDIILGFLPPNRLAPQGEGGLAFSISPQTGLPNLTLIKNTALIYFDYNPPIPTPVWTNTLDKGLPSSSMKPLTTTSRSTTLTLGWHGTDAESGTRLYDVFVSVNGGNYQSIVSATADSTFQFVGKADSTYRFYSVAYDGVYNQELIPLTFDTETTIRLSTTTIQSLRSGSWNDVSTWSCGCIPTESDDVVVQPVHIVTLDSTMPEAACRSLELLGTFSMQGSSIIINGTRIVVDPSNVITK